MASYKRDPLSERFDGKARELVEKAYRVKGEWAGGYVPPPGPQARQWMASHGILFPYERDRWGEIRWIRAYKRSVFHLVAWYGGVNGLRGERNTGAGGGGWHAPVRVQWETGLLVSKPEWAAARWAVRIRIHSAGDATSRIGREKAAAAGDAWITADGHATFRQSTPDDRGY
jgi:hypothetical protein